MAAPRKQGGSGYNLAVARLFVKSVSVVFRSIVGWRRDRRRSTLPRMGRHKTISDDDVLRIARDVFRHHGHTATTRDIAKAAGISEAILYQRFGSKDDLFFAAMRPSGPDVEQILGPDEPMESGRDYLRSVVVRLAKHFAEVIPQALHLMMHPSFDHGAFARAHPHAHVILQQALAVRLTSLARRKRMTIASAELSARLFISLAHDWALASVMAHGAPSRDRELREMVDIVWKGMQPRDE
jgi:AcrR family transcriptional regulator